VAKLLLEKGADLEPKDKEYGRTPLSCVAEKTLVGGGVELIQNPILGRGRRYSRAV
jgi:hypothetical protein